MAEEALEFVNEADPQLTDPTGGEGTPGEGDPKPSGAEPKPGDPPTPTDGEGEKDNLQKRFDELTGEKWALSRQLEDRDGRITALEAKVKGIEGTRTPATPTGQPQRIDFDSDEAYVQALTDYSVTQKLEASRREDQTRAEEDRNRESQARLQKSLAEGGAKYDNFAQIAYNTPFDYTPQMLQVMATLEDPAGVAHHLGKNHALGYEIASLGDPIAVAARLGQVQQLVKAGPGPEPKAVTGTPSPSEPTAGGGGASGHTVESLAKMDQTDFNRTMRELRVAKGVI